VEFSGVVCGVIVIEFEVGVAGNNIAMITDGSKNRLGSIVLVAFADSSESKPFEELPCLWILSIELFKVLLQLAFRWCIK